jgi:ADP-ribose pyrophosphatase YjhB (NUDIX family)
MTGMKALLAPFYRIQRWLWRIFRPRTRGVKVMLFNDAGEVLLVRNTYGRTDLFVLPGGGVHPFEAPEAAARREVKEEVACAVEGLVPVSIHVSAVEGKRDTVHLYRARAVGDVRVDGFEVAEAHFFALDALPPKVSPATLRRIEEHRGLRAVEAAW